MKNLPVTSKRCLELARVIRDGSTGLKLDMGLYLNHCGTAGCVVGHALFMYDRELFDRCGGKGRTEKFEERDRARDLLGLTDKQALFLFDTTQRSPSVVAAELELLAMENAA